MKRINNLLTLFLCGIVLGCFPTKAMGPSICRLEDGEEIPLVREDEYYLPDAPRTSDVPVSCDFDENNENLYFSFLFPMGEVTITLTEYSVGIVSSDDYVTSSWPVVVPVPGPGNYNITVQVEPGIEYSGHFMY